MESALTLRLSKQPQINFFAHARKQLRKDFKCLYFLFVERSFVFRVFNLAMQESTLNNQPLKKYLDVKFTSKKGIQNIPFLFLMC